MFAAEAGKLKHEPEQTETMLNTKKKKNAHRSNIGVFVLSRIEYPQ